jgi:molybdopterin converting factor small subunit
MTLEVTVRFVGVLHEVFKKKRTKLKFGQSPTVKEIIEKLGGISAEARRRMLDPESNQIHPALLILVNGREVGALKGSKTLVEKEDEVVLISVSHGG